jgi:HSP20 family protein
MRFRNEVDRLFSRFFGDPWSGESAATYGGWAPDVDMSERDREISIRAEIPGLDPHDIRISVTGNLLTISGEKKEVKEERKADYQVSEIRYGAFYRTIPLPESANADDVKAEYDQGVLSVRIGKKEGASARRIEVKPGRPDTGQAA